MGLSAPADAVGRLAAALTGYQKRIGTRWRAHEVHTQAVLTIAWWEGGHTYRALGAGNGVPKSTCRTLVAEGIKVLARRALPLTEIIQLARRAGWPYLIVDGVNIPTERVAARWGWVQYWYSGKHRRHGAAVQTVAAPDGELLWVSGVLPGRTVDITAARRFKIARRWWDSLGCWPIWATSACIPRWSPATSAGVARTACRRENELPTRSWPGCAVSGREPTPSSRGGGSWPTTSAAGPGS